ncbi:MAG: dockerin type I repeat-containing protein [Clostridia bacterium]|nr:dockerin type I repeat-containing protein [Clostridia bacterium]
MKRIGTVLLVVALLVGVLSADMLSYARAASQTAGDVNGDGTVNNRDLGLLQQWLGDWDVTIVGDADLNGDGRINNQDLGLLQQRLGGEEQESMYAATKYVNLGAPAAKHYPSDYLARCAWDMILFEDRLYVGCGNYSQNSGDAPVLSCPLDDLGNWTVEAILPDEQVGRFYDYNGVLTIPGFDPVGAPARGNYYELVDGVWQTRTVLPYGLHNFDVVWFEGRLYAAVGANRGESPIAYTEDGVTYDTLPLYKDGQPIATDNSNVIRSMNLYVLGGNLYADFWYEDEDSYRSTFEMYRYNEREDRFEFTADLKTATHGGLYSSAGLPLWEKESLGGRMFLTTGYLYYTTDFVKYTPLEMPYGAVVYDMMAYGGRLYLLTAYEKSGAYQVTVYSVNAANPTALRTEATYTHSLMPTAFAVNADHFFIGMGNWYGVGSVGNGTILQVKR